MEQQAKILIVDDEPIIRDILEGLLFTQGYDLAFAANGVEALEQVSALNPDMILLDVMMPSMDGFQVCQHLKAHPQWQHIPVILVTALNSKEDIRRGLDAGANDFLNKPFDNLELLARVRSMLRLKRQYDLLEAQRTVLAESLHLKEQIAQVTAQHLQELEILHNLGLHLMNSLNTDSVLGLVSKATLDMIPQAQHCVVHLLSNADQYLLPVVFSPQTYTKMVYHSLGIEELVWQTLTSGQPACIANVGSISNTSGDAQFDNICALLVVPLVDEQHTIGAISVASSQEGAFAENQRRILSILANQATVAIAKARFFEERRRSQAAEKEVIRSLFQRYVSPAVVERLVDGRETLSLGGKRQDVAILFADIRGFTSFSEELSPESVVETLNQYLALAVEAILAEEGTLDKFMGDAVMALFNAPLPQLDSTLRAVRAAMAMQQAIMQYNNKLPKHEPLSYGVGIHFDQAIVGNIGTAQQMNYTAIGDTVNLAKRLQESARGGEVLLSEAAYLAVKEAVIATDLGPTSMRGRSAKEHVYTLIAIR